MTHSWYVTFEVPTDGTLSRRRHPRLTQTFETEAAAKDFARIKPKLAVYTHYTRPRRDDIPEVTIPEIISRTRAIYSGRLEAGEDLMSVSIGDSVTVKRYGE